MRALHSGRHTPADLTLGFQSRVLAASAGLGDTCDYVFLCAGETQSAFVADRNEWWGCLRGGLRLSAPGHDCLLMGGGELFAPAQGMRMQVRAMVDTILVRAVPQQQDDAAPAVSLPEGARCCALGSIAAIGMEEAGVEPGQDTGGGRGMARSRSSSSSTRPWTTGPGACRRAACAGRCATAARSACIGMRPMRMPASTWPSCSLARSTRRIRTSHAAWMCCCPAPGCCAASGQAMAWLSEAGAVEAEAPPGTRTGAPSRAMRWWRPEGGGKGPGPGRFSAACTAWRRTGPRAPCRPAAPCARWPALPRRA